MAGRGRSGRFDDGIEPARGARGRAVLDRYGEPLDDLGALDDDDPDAGADWPGTVVSVRRRRRRGLHLGPLAITPTRVTLAIALIGSVGFLAYAITVRDPSQIPLLASGAAVLGIVFAALALAGAVGSMRAGRESAGGRAFALALGGGVAAVIAFGCFGAAIVLALVWRR